METVLQEQARAFTKYRRDDGKVTKPLKRVIHVMHALSTSLVCRTMRVTCLPMTDFQVQLGFLPARVSPSLSFYAYPTSFGGIGKRP